MPLDGYLCGPSRSPSPGIVAASATRVLGSYLFSQGRVIYNTYATFIASGGPAAA